MDYIQKFLNLYLIRKIKNDSFKLILNFSIFVIIFIIIITAIEQNAYFLPYIKVKILNIFLILSVLSLLFAYTDISLFMKLPLIGQDWRFISQIKNEGDEWSDVFDDHLNSHFGTPKINVRFDDDALAIAVNMAPPEEIKPFGPQDEMRQIAEEFIIDINRNTGSIFLRQTNEMEFNPNLFPPSQISLLPRAQIYITGSSTCSLVGEKKF